MVYEASVIHDVFDKRLIDPFCIVLSSSPILLLDHCPQHYCPQQHFSVGVQGFERVPSIDLSGLYTLLRYFLGECPLGKCYTLAVFNFSAFGCVFLDGGFDEGY